LEWAAGRSDAPALRSTAPKNLGATTCQILGGTGLLSGDQLGLTDSTSYRRETVLLVGQAPMPPSLRPYLSSPFLSIEVAVDPATGVVVGVQSSATSATAGRLLQETLLGRRMEEGWQELLATVEGRYFAADRVALIEAVRGIQEQYLRWARSDRLDKTPQIVRSDLLDADPASAGSTPSRVKSRLASALVTLLAHSRLLDGYDADTRVGRPLPPGARRQAVQLYAVIQQILHSLQVESGLLEPRIEPVSVPDLLERCFRRCPGIGTRVPVIRHFADDLGTARGDHVVLEEAMVLLLDEASSYAYAAGADLEVATERRRAEVQITIALRAGEARSSPDEGELASGTAASDPVERMWEAGLGTLAARTLIEHQGGRLWMQDQFPHGHHILCVSLPANATPEDSEAREARVGSRDAAGRTKGGRVTPSWR